MFTFIYLHMYSYPFVDTPIGLDGGGVVSLKNKPAPSIAGACVRVLIIIILQRGS